MRANLHDRDLSALVAGFAGRDPQAIAHAVERLSPDVDELTRSFAVLHVAARRINGAPDNHTWRDVRLAVAGFLDALDMFTTVPAFAPPRA